MKKPRISALNPVLDGYEDNRNKENNAKQASIPLSRGIRNRKRRKLRQPSSSGSTGSNSSISGVSRGSSDDLTPIHVNEQEMPMSAIQYKAEGNNNIIEEYLYLGLEVRFIIWFHLFHQGCEYKVILIF